jgi:L-aspartate oxidase
VSRAILARMSRTGSTHVWLDATGLDHFAERFPTINVDLQRAGLDPIRDWLPVAPAAHHQCGGIITDLHGATSLPGLWAAGETSCSGVHGANRLASNSLLEGMVFAPRAVEAISGGSFGPAPSGAMRVVLGEVDDGDDLSIGGRPLELPDTPEADPAAGGGAEPSVQALRMRLQEAMSAGAGVLRDAARLRGCSELVAQVAGELAAREKSGVVDLSVVELRNLVDIARVVISAATARTETRGSHSRADHPETDPEQRHRLVVGGAGSPVQHFQRDP